MSEPVKFWWQDADAVRVAPFDYPPERVRSARRQVEELEPQLPAIVRGIVSESRTQEEVVRRLACFVQAALVHPPLWQPAEAPLGYWHWRGWAPTKLQVWPRIAGLLGQRLVTDPEILLRLGEARCGQCVAVLIAGLALGGIKSRPWQLPHHIVTEVELDGVPHVVDADAFKNGILLEQGGKLVTRRALEENPYLVDRFKPTGWMFRRDSAYARGAGGIPFRGYIDFYSPEVDGQISARYGAEKTLHPPGIPRWVDADRVLRVEAGSSQELAFTVAHADRTSGYRVRCGRTSRGYSYDNLVMPRLGYETSCEIFEIERTEPNIVVRFAERGRHYLAAAAVPNYTDRFPSYVWWSDELIVDVI